MRRRLVDLHDHAVGLFERGWLLLELLHLVGRAHRLALLQSADRLLESQARKTESTTTGTANTRDGVSHAEHVARPPASSGPTNRPTAVSSPIERVDPGAHTDLW